MRIYLDSSALVKRALNEPESGAFQDAFDDFVEAGAVIAASALAWVEVSRAVRLRRDLESPRVINDVIDAALSGLDQYPITEQVVAVAQRLSPVSLRSLDAIHLATASLLDADLVCAYDQRLVGAAEELGFRTLSPGASA